MWHLFYNKDMKNLLKGIAFILIIVALGSYVEGERAGLPSDQLTASVILTPILALGAGALFLSLIVSALMVTNWWPKQEDRDELERFKQDFPERK